MNRELWIKDIIGKVLEPEGFSYTHKDENRNRNFKDIYIYDENKSVKWNKEHREELVNKYYEEIDKIHRASNEKEEKFKFCKLCLDMGYKCTTKESSEDMEYGRAN